MDKIIAGNWKMNHSLKTALEFADSFIPLVKDSSHKIIVCAPFPLLPALKQKFQNTNISPGAQNLSYEESGAFTGEVSAAMLADFCTYVIVGHSERRNTFKETSELVNKKTLKALSYSLTPIVCFGESLEIREKNQTEQFLEKQLNETLAGFTNEQISKLIIAYEPIWAIGTGKTATTEQAQEAHSFIHSWVSKKYSQTPPILYGGSVKPENAKPLLSQKDVSGALVGGASIKPDIFAKIVNYQNR